MQMDAYLDIKQVFSIRNEVKLFLIFLQNICFKPCSYLTVGTNTTPRLQILSISNLQQIQRCLNSLW